MEDNENVRVCSCCGCEIEEGDNFREYDGEIYCESCFDDEFVTCEDCGEIIPRDDAYLVKDDGYYICEGCYEDNYFWCICYW